MVVKAREDIKIHQFNFAAKLRKLKFQFAEVVGFLIMGF